MSPKFFEQKAAPDDMPDDGDMIQIFPEELQPSNKKLDLPDNVPILPLRNTVLFPGVVIPITVGREKSIKLVKDAHRKGAYIGVVSQINPEVEDPNIEDINEIGTVAQILKLLVMPDDSTSVIIQGKKRFKIKNITKKEPYFEAKIDLLDDKIPKKEVKEFDAIIQSLKDMSTRIIQLSPHIPPEAQYAIKNIDNPQFLINFISANSDIEFKDKQKLLEIPTMKERAMELMRHLSMEIQKLELKNNIQSKVKTEMDQQQREYYLNQQIKTIKSELGGDPHEQEIEELKIRAKDKKWNKEVGETFEKEIAKLSRINPAAPDFHMQLNYLQTMLDLPWNEYTDDNFDLKRAKNILDGDHYGLEKIKERILEHLAVLKLKGDMKSPIICLYGPPGVGKTSLGKSVAAALDRKYVRMSLGGLHDEAEIRGHRKAYIGAMPGRILQSLKKAKSSNPVFVLDEIDKIGNDFRGDPSHALLEVLDPEQNSAFYDNYLEIDYDLSKVLFIATANSLSTIKPALRDRMELINVTGYVIEEKVQIAKNHLLTKQLLNHGLKPKHLKISESIFEFIIENSTRESGVRDLDNKLSKICRNIAKKVGFEEKYNVTLKQDDVVDIMGQPIFLKEKYLDNKYIGVVTGLAWTQVGGDILFVEVSLSKGKGKLTLTGNMGNVMKESAMIAAEFLKSKSKQLNIKEKLIEDSAIHIHIPQGAIPKDGPSAGITMTTALASAFTGRKVRKGLAMTGEITLRGKILPVGGIKEKILAAKRAGLTDILLPKENRKDIEEINELYVKGLTFHYMDEILEALEFALLPAKKKKVEDVDDDNNTSEKE